MSGPGTPTGTHTSSSSTQPTPKGTQVKAIGAGGIHQRSNVVQPNHVHTDRTETETTTSNHKVTGPAGIRIQERTDTVTKTKKISENTNNDGYANQASESIAGGVIIIDHVSGGGASKSSGQASTSPHKPKPAKKPIVALPAEDAIVITTGVDKLQYKNVDIGVDADADAMMLAAAAQRLRKALEKGGALGDEAKADLGIKGLEDVEKLSVLLQKDYTSVQEGTIKLQYTDHRDPSFNAAVGEISITHQNVVQLANAFNKAEKAVQAMATNVSAGETVSQADITNTVRTTLKKELSTTL